HAPQIENFKELIDYHATVKTINPYAFAVCLLPHSGSIAKEVSAFLSSKGTKMPIEELNFDGLRQHNLEDFINQLRIKRREFETKEATEIHLFIAGPIMSGVLIGAEFDNWKPVKLYHQNRDTKQYEFWCPLTK
ncbi:SAVED domain-containing protein, partial [bacterium]|nr:SAVED domain-containing protein [bacterium]